MWRTLMIGSLLGLLSGCSGLPFGQSSDHPDYSAEGKASYYARMHHGQRTASGERHDQNALVAAHRSLPFGTRVQVTNLANGRKVTVRINDRGPFRRGRIIDLSRAAAQQIGMIERGVVAVRIETVE